MSGGYLGCCPDIVRGPKGSVIEPFTGYRGNVAIIVDWGYHRRHWRRPCTPSDHGFMYVNFCVNACEWLSLSQYYLVLAIIFSLHAHCHSWYVNWGDGTYNIGTQENLGPFQKAHQYPKYIASYGVTVYYCSNPGSPKCNFRRCCDNIYQTIYVSYDPQHPFPPGTFKNWTELWLAVCVY